MAVALLVCDMMCMIMRARALSVGWRDIEDWKCASKGCCYDNKGPATVGTENTKVSQPTCFFPNAAPSNYDLSGSFAAAGGSSP